MSEHTDASGMPTPQPRGPWGPTATNYPDLLGLLARVQCHVYSGVMLPDGTYQELFTGPGANELLGGPSPYGTDMTVEWHDAIHPDDWETYAGLGATLGVDDTTRAEYRLRGKDGITRWVLDQLWVRERRSDGALVVDGVVTDVSELHARTVQAQDATAWLEAAVTASPAALVMLDPQGRVLLWNPAAERMFGWRQHEVVGRVAPYLPAEKREDLLAHMRAFMEEDRVLIEQEEVQTGRDGVRRHITISSATVRGPHGEIRGFMAVINDISARKEMENRLRHLAHSDPLTGLANRVLLSERIEEASARAHALHRDVALLLLDLDGFKAVNDSFGHGMGDELLVAVAGRLLACLRTQDVAARLGGDEFAILLEVPDDEEALHVGRRVLAALSTPFSLRRAQVVISASIGVALAGRGRTTQDLLRDADVAMYMAKAEGKNRLVVFEPSMQERVATRLQFEHELRDAIDAGQLDVHYQPTVNLDTGRIIGLEALVRWNHPDRGLLSPVEFIRVAEDTGLVVPLGAWVIDRACTQIAQWQIADPSRSLSVAVNFSPRQIQDAGVVDAVRSALEASSLPPSALVVEITEELLLEETSLADRRLSELRRLGVRVALDDFGTGYSSLAYLRRFPVDTLKIDRSFVAPLGTGSRPAALVRSIIDLAAALEMDTVAEGVETAEQARILRDLGCRVAQGHFFSEPLPAEAIAPLLHDGLPINLGL